MTRNLKIGSLTVGFFLGVSLLTQPFFVFAEENTVVLVEPTTQEAPIADYVTPSEQSFRVVDELRDEADLSDGRKVMRIYQSPRDVYYDRGVLRTRPLGWNLFSQNLKSKFENTSSNGYEFSAPFQNQDSVVVRSGDYEIRDVDSLEISKIEKPNASILSRKTDNNSDISDFKNLYKNVDIKFNDFGNYRKKFITINKKPDVKEKQNVIFWEEYNIPNDVKVFGNDGSEIYGVSDDVVGQVTVSTSNGEKFVIDGAIIYDGSLKDVNEIEMHAETIKEIVEVDHANNKMRIGLKIPSEYFLSTDRVFPVTVDPTYYTCNQGSGSNIGTCNINEAYLRYMTSNNILAGQSTAYLLLGYYDDGTGPATRQPVIGFMQNDVNYFPNLSSYGTLSSAKLYLTRSENAGLGSTSGSAIPTHVMKITNPWSKSTVIYGHPGTQNDGIHNYLSDIAGSDTSISRTIASGVSVAWDVTSAVQDWISGGNNYGLYVEPTPHWASGSVPSWAMKNFWFRSSSWGSSGGPYLELVMNPPKPNLTENGPFFSPSSVQVGQQVAITFKVKNTTATPVNQTSVLKYYVNPEYNCSSRTTYLGSITVPTLGNYGTNEQAVYYTPATAGNYCFQFDIDANYNVDESLESDNNYYMSSILAVTNVPKPDLTYTSGSLNKYAFNPGETINATIGEKNQGTGNAGSTYVYFYLNKDSASYSNNYVGQTYLTSLPANTQTSVDFNYTLPSNLTAGTYYLSYFIDGPGNINESNENNNQNYFNSIAITINKPDLTPNFFSINSNSYYTDNAFSTNVLVENTGSASASNVGYLMQIQDTANGSVYNMTGCSSIGNIPGNSTNVYTLSCTLPSSLSKSSANYYVNVNIDNNNYIDESNESNNTRQGSGTIVVVQYNYGGGGGGGADPNNNQVTLATKATVVNSNPLIAVNTQLANVSTYKNNNQISSDKTSGNHTADPVNSRNGAFEFSQTDFTLRGLSLPIDFTRTYNSRYLERNVRFGQGWGNSYHMFYYQNPTTNEVQIYLGGALVSYFTPSGDGVNYVAGRGDFNTLYKESDYLVYKTQDGIKYRFSLKTTGDTNVAVLKEIEDTNGNKTILGYSNVRDVELLSSITDSSGRVYTFIYPSSTATDWDKVKEIHESISGSDRLIARFTYNVSLNLTQVHHESSYTGESTQNIDEYYEYDANGLMTKYTDARGTILFNEYDSSGRVTKQYEHNARVDGANVATKRLVYELTYNDSADAGVPGSAHCTITKNYRDASNHYDEKFCFNSDELKIYSEKGANIEKWSYDANGMASQYTDANNNITTYQYDSRRRLIQQVLPDTTVWHTVSNYEYEDNFNRLLKKIDNVSAVSAPNTVLYTKMTSTTIDGKGNVIGIKDTANNLEGFEYNVNGTIKKYTDKKGSITNFTYNANGYLTDESNSVTDVDGIVTTISKHYVYDNYGNRTNVTDGRGNVYAYAYDSLNNLRKITDPYSKTKLYQYDLESHRTKETDELGHVVDYSFDTDINAGLLGLVKRSASGDITNSRQYDYVGNVIKEIDPLNLEISFGYDSANRVITKTDPRKTTTYEYNANGKLKKATTTAGTRVDYFYDARGNKTEEHRFFDATNYITLKWEYDGFNRVTKEIDGNNKSAVYEYDLMDRVTKKTDAKNGVNQFSYDANGNKTGERNPRATADVSLRNSGGQSVSYVYDNLNRLIKTINAQNKETWYFYDGNNNLTKQVDWKNSDGTEATHVTQNTYDNLNRKTKTTFADGGELNFTYFDNGTVKTKTDQVGRVTTYTYDDFNRLTNEQDNGGKNTGYTYDKAGNKKTVTYPDSTQDKYDYNDLNKIAKVTDQLNNFSSYEYDAEGNKTKEIDKNNHENNFVYDKLGRPVSETNAQGTVTSYTYDGNNNRLTQTVDGKTTSFVYDELNRNTKITYPGNKTENFAYDANGNRTSYTNGNGEIITYTYDSLNRNTGKNLSDANPVSYAYDNWSNLKNLVEDSGTNVYVYDVMNRATSETKTFKYLDDKQYIVAKEYFADGQLKKLTDATNKVVDYVYDSRGLLQGVTYSGTTLASYTYTAYGKPSVVTYGNGVVTTYTYDGLNRTKKIETKDNTGKVLWSESYDYDNDSNRTKMTDHTGRTVDYGYDNLNQLLNTSYNVGGVTSTFSYTYDNSGNRTSYTTPLNNLTYNYTAGTNELAGVIDGALATNIQYNNQGSVIKEQYSGSTFTGEVNYTYTAENRLKNIDYVNNGVHNGVDFSYDDFGNRTRKRTFLNGETATYYLNQGLTVLNEIDINGNVTKTIVQALGQIAEIDSANNITYIHQDVLDSTALITDNTGAVVGEYDYDAFGAIIGYNGNTETNYTYTNQEYDPETELYYYNARYYNPMLGRFLTRDTVLGRDGDLLSRNLYIYVKNNPLKYVDPTGNEEKYLGKTLNEWNNSIKSANENINFVGDLLTFGGFSKAFDRAGQAGQRMHDEGVNLDTVGNTIYQVTFGTVEAGGGALVTGVTMGELKIIVTPYFATKAIEQESKIITAPEGYKFTQNKYSPNFSNKPESNFEFKGQSVESVANRLKTGEISSSNLPIDYVERNGVKNILNTRSTVVNVIANTVPKFVGKTGDPFYEQLLDNQLQKYGGQVFDSVIKSLGSLIK